MKNSLGLLFAILTIFTTQISAATLGERLSDIDEFVAPLVEDRLFSGSILIVQNDKPLYSRAWGDANVEGEVSYTVETQNNIASLTKPITGIVLQQLYAEKKLKGGDRLSQYIPEFPGGEKIRISHLMTHRAGIPHRVTDDTQEQVPQTATGMVSLIMKKELLFEPGKERLYSSAGYTVLARVLEIVEGKPYAQIVRERIFDPAGMENSYDATAISESRKPARSYVPTVEAAAPAPQKDLSFLVGAGSIYSTTGDLARLVSALRNGNLGGVTWTRIRALYGKSWRGITNG